MPTTRAAAVGLSTADLERIRDTLATGRRPKVMFTDAAGQIAGQTGQVVQLQDPAASDEWVVVRFGHDELPFSPTDLTFPPRNGSSASRRAAAASPAATVPAPLQEEYVTTNRPTTETERTTAPESTRAPGRARDAADADKPAKPAKAAKGRTARTRTPPGLTVTLEYQAGEWTVTAHQGTKVLAKPYLLKPSEALKMVGMLDVPGVHEAVEHLVATERAEAEQRAEQLRAQLAEVEEQLAELREAR
jgi:hypothetical protein